VDLRDYLRILRKRWIIIVAATLLGTAASAAVTIATAPEYEASTLVYIQVQSTGTVGELAQGSTFIQNQVKSFAEVVGTPRVLDSVITTLDLPDSAVGLAQSVVATAPLDTVNVKISVTRDDPMEAAEIANAVTASFREVVGDITASTGAVPTSQVTVSVLKDATTPLSPTSPNTPLNIVLGVIAGLAIGLTIAILREILDTRIRGERDVLALTDAPIIGGISFDPGASERPLIVQDDPRSVRAEAFRTLRTNLQFLEADAGARSFVVTSSIPSEGKTTTAANLAIALADSGAQVVLIDADLRRPKVSDYMGLEGAVGLTDVLIARAELADVLQPWGRGNLVVLPAGAVPPNPSELLGSRAMNALIKSLESEFDVVILDLPPLLPVTDAALVSKLTRGTLLVVAAGRTHKGEFAGAVSSLANVGANLAGVIITMMPTKGPDAYGYGRYGYGTYGYDRTDTSAADIRDGAYPGEPRKRLSPNWGNEPTTDRR
jgi:succinoglycan biosynthesis transport protein ExoP